jgi:hypothetical protein
MMVLVWAGVIFPACFAPGRLVGMLAVPAYESTRGGG